jgi:hypothetical protein
MEVSGSQAKDVGRAALDPVLLGTAGHVRAETIHRDVEEEKPDADADIKAKVHADPETEAG